MTSRVVCILQDAATLRGDGTREIAIFIVHTCLLGRSGTWEEHFLLASHLLVVAGWVSCIAHYQVDVL
jgi:hypothetical protein